MVDRIAEILRRQGMSLRALSLRSGVPYMTLSNLMKTGGESAKLPTLRGVAGCLGLTLDQLIEGPLPESGPRPASGSQPASGPRPVSKAVPLCAQGAEGRPLSPDALRTARDFEALDAHGRAAVRSILEVELTRCRAERPHPAPAPAEETVEMIVYNDAAAAGSPLYAESDYERLCFPASRVPPGADFGVRINGQSMEPTVSDRSIVWVRKQEHLNSGEVGIFHTDDGAVCKRYVVTGAGGVELRSDNPAYPHLKGSALQGLRCFGKVLLDE